MTLGIALITIGLLGICCAVYFTISTANDKFAWLLFSIVLVPIGIILDINKKPTSEDVIKGKAMYQEHLIITNNDTTKIYEIIWKTNKNK